MAISFFEVENVLILNNTEFYQVYEFPLSSTLKFNGSIINQVPANYYVATYFNIQAKIESATQNLQSNYQNTNAQFDDRKIVNSSFIYSNPSL